MISGGDQSALFGLAGSYLGVIAITSVIVWCFIVLAGRVATGVAYDLRHKSFSRLQELSFSWFDTRPQGWILSRLTSDCTKLSS